MAPRGRPSGSDRRGLIARAAAGDGDAQRQVFDSQRAMLGRLARERADRGLPAEDLVQEGSLGVLGAIHDFAGAGETGTDFDVLAEKRAAAEMDAALDSELEARRRDEQMVNDANAFDVAEARLSRELGRPATAAELAARLKWTLERVDEVAAAVADARERDDEDLLQYIDPEDVDLLDLLGPDGGAEEPPPNGS